MTLATISPFFIQNILASLTATQQRHSTFRDPSANKAHGVPLIFHFCVISKALGSTAITSLFSVDTNRTAGALSSVRVF